MPLNALLFKGSYSYYTFMPTQKDNLQSAIGSIIKLGGFDESQLNPLPSSGSYALIIDVARKINLRPEKPWTIEPGVYIYAGRASRSLPVRLERHKKRVKPIHWHIDRITTHQTAKIMNTIILPDHPEQECAIIRALVSTTSSSFPFRRFGSSDCKEGCPAHLIMIANSKRPHIA